MNKKDLENIRKAEILLKENINPLSILSKIRSIANGIEWVHTDGKSGKQFEQQTHETLIGNEFALINKLEALATKLNNMDYWRDKAMTSTRMHEKAIREGR
tara:strand:+ start:199 stop:501 length:303 start_codon:yes stop_codon:yes gene_type:complete